MNKRDWIVFAVISRNGYGNHREIAKRTGYSLGLVNSSLKKLMEEGYIDNYFYITDKGREYIEASKPRRAVILAAGMGLRMVPINKTPKGLLTISGQPLIERIIEQMHEAGIFEIYVVVGYMMERFEYLRDKYGVELVISKEFPYRDSLHSLNLVADKLDNCYIAPSNVWFSRNPFSRTEFFSWYAVSEYVDDDSFVRMNRSLELIYTGDEKGGNSMLGLCYLLKEDAEIVRGQLVKLDKQRKFNREIWEQALFEGNKMIPYARVMLGQSNYAIRTYEELRDLDSESQHLDSKRINLIREVFNVEMDDITDISALSKGMTNRLMRFSVKGKPYLFRVPGEGSNELTSRAQEVDVYNSLKETGLTDIVIYMSAETGYKISEFWENARTCDIHNDEDVRACIMHLRKLHSMKLEVGHTFDLTEKLDLYERLRDGEPSFSDYDETREKVVGLIALLNVLQKESCLCHVDPVSDNFLFVNGKIHLIDWEYAGMSEKHIDIAMFCLYADYDVKYVNHLIDVYFDGKATNLDRFKVFAYASVGGFLWSVWCEYKEKKGVSFSEYAMQQYRYSKKSYREAMRYFNAHGKE
ncbi:UTP--glucose-1-phosphate uridylyltransferase [Oxobacter pfennigii]|uniref:UTP--glucose-1-phosphate uridylyltransferase n=1 Tax=Oxobacter pfennigii TaxID=36849 RepID=A0A0P8X0M6_9CLOT|nr:NTP transferase domain-containing protein [Oxobacter pfennigii]KPU44319.1 UTP--glucose-1-phosphate uridylyltransferase [Oxobacter pfennigii]